MMGQGMKGLLEKDPNATITIFELHKSTFSIVTDYGYSSGTQGEAGSNPCEVSPYIIHFM
jgi:hypothetical protein